MPLSAAEKAEVRELMAEAVAAALAPTPKPPSRFARLAADARNRALRTFLQGLGIDALVAAALAVYSATDGADNDIAWRLLVLTLVKTVLHSAASYTMRRFGDPSRLPTPLPPKDPGPPAEVAPGA